MFLKASYLNEFVHCFVMGFDFLGLVERSRALNSKIVSLPRLLLLFSLGGFGEDGVAYRELKAGLKLNDGLLFSNLRVLREMGFVRVYKNREFNRELDVFTITKEGGIALERVRQWLKELSVVEVI